MDKSNQKSRRVVRFTALTLLLMALILLFISPKQVALSQDKYKGGPPPKYAQNPKFKTDLEFAKMLQKNWMKTEALPGLAMDTKPKPGTPPVAKPTPKDTTNWQAARKISRPVRIKEPAKPAPISPPPGQLPTLQPPPIKKPIEPKAPTQQPLPPAPTTQPAPPTPKAPVQQPTPPPQQTPVQQQPTPQPSPPEPAPQQPIQPKQPISEPPPTGALRSVNVNFFEAAVAINYDPKMAVSAGGAVSNQSIAGYWEKMAQINPEAFLGQLKTQKNAMELNDWGYYLLLQRTAEGIYGSSSASANLLTWYLLVKSGYDARAGYYDNQVYLLIPSKEVLYEIPNFTIGGKKYYLATKVQPGASFKSLFIYDGKYPGADKSFDIMVLSPPNLKQIAQNRTLKFNYAGQDYTIAAQFDKNLINYFNEYPQTDLYVYFDASLSAEASYSLLTALKPIIAGKSEADAVNIILRFVQIAFEYKTDGDQFGHEKYFFPEESLFYPFNDCEDRSIIFSYLVRKLTGLAVVGLDYPGHVATAVKFSDDLPGDNVTYNGKKYLVCDPTYIGADIGMAQTAYKTVKPTVIKIQV